MAKVDEDLDLDVGAEKKKGGGKMKSIIIFSVIGVVLIGLSVALTLFLIGGDKGEGGAEADATKTAAESKADAKAQAAASGEAVAYLNLDPAFVVNLDSKEGDVRYLQVNMSVMVNQEADLEQVKAHMPVLRHHLNLLFSSLDFNDIRDRKGKNKLTDETLKVVQDALKEAGGEPVVTAVFFNSIVGQ